MLSFFPYPYPDELWYSVLCRYHVRSGNESAASTKNELYPKRLNAQIGSFFPNGILKDVLEQLPEGYLDIQDIAYNHSLFKFYYRFESLEKKKEALGKIMSGGCVSLGRTVDQEKMHPKLRFCPQCLKEELKEYGEGYWHVLHQIPLMNVCLKHQCALKTYYCQNASEKNSNFLLPVQCESKARENEVKGFDYQLSKMLESYQKLPFEMGPTIGYNNIFEGLMNAGYGSARNRMEFLLDLQHLSADLISFFGKELIETQFLGSIVNHGIISDMRSWKGKRSERYAILATFLNQSPEITFGEVQIENIIIKQFREMSERFVTRSKAYVANELGVKPETLDILASNLQIQPFWKSEAEKCIAYDRVSIMMTPEIKQRVKEIVRANGYRSMSDYIMYCVERMLKKNGY